MDRPPVLLFDLDGTLVDSAFDIATSLSILAARRGGVPVRADAVRSLVRFGVETVVHEGLGKMAGDDLAADIAAFRSILATIPPDPAAIYPGVLAALEGFAAAGHPMAVVTNKPEHLSRSLLDGLGMAHHFGALVGGDTLTTRKPDPAPLTHARAMLGTPEHPAIMIGDSAIDADAAFAIGIPFVLFDGGYGGGECADERVAIQFSGFDELARCVAAV